MDPGSVWSLLPNSQVNCSDLSTDRCAAVFYVFFEVLFELVWCFTFSKFLSYGCFYNLKLGLSSHVLLPHLILHMHLLIELPTVVISYLWLIVVEVHMWCSHVWSVECYRRILLGPQLWPEACGFSNKWRCCGSVYIPVGDSWCSRLNKTARSHCSN